MGSNVLSIPSHALEKTEALCHAFGEESKNRGWLVLGLDVAREVPEGYSGRRVMAEKPRFSRSASSGTPELVATPEPGPATFTTLATPALAVLAASEERMRSTRASITAPDWAMS